MTASPTAVSSSAASTAHEQSASPRRKLRADDLYFGAMMLLIVGTVFLGFARTYYLAGIYHTHVRNLLIGVHGAVFSTWIVLLVVQTTLVARRNIALHRRLGIFGAGLAVAMVGLGVAAATDSLARGFTPPGFPLGPVVFYCISTSNIAKFAVLIFFAIWLRSNGSAHKRLVLLATLALMIAAVGRWPFAFTRAHQGLIVTLMMLSLVVFDLSTIRRIHRATLLGLLFLIVTGALTLPIARSAGWHKFATLALHVWAHLGYHRIPILEAATMVPHAKRQSIRPAASRLAVTLMAAAFALPAAAQAPPHSEWITLGTGGGPVPSPTQAQPANLLHYADQFIVVDAGDGTLEQLVKANIPLGAVRTVFLSHMHFDHTSGLFAVLGNRYQVGAPPITVYGPAGTKKLVDGLVAAMQPFVDIGPGGLLGQGGGRLPPKDYVTVVEIPDGGSLQVGAIKVTAVRNTHYSTPKESPEYRYPSFAYRFDLPDRSIAYTGDTGPSPAVEKLAAGADLLVSEIGDSDFTLGELKAKGVNLNAGIVHHFTAEHLSPTNAGLLARHAGVKHLVLTHQGLRPGSEEETKAKVAANFTGTVVIAKDLDRF